jgi:AcrR family transcriptional regulator
MSFVAGEADISKSLLFYYFKNKKEYYMFLFNTAIEFLSDRKTESIHEEKNDLFELVNQEIERRLQIMHDYPYLLRFVAKAYYESEKEIKSELETKKRALTRIGKEDILKLIDYKQFQDPSDANVLIDIILFLAEGCMRGREDLNDAKIRGILPEFQDMMNSLKRHYYK